MNSIILVLFGIILLGVGCFLYSKAHQNYVYPAIAGLLLLLVGVYTHITKSQIVTRENFSNGKLKSAESEASCSEEPVSLSSGGDREAFDNSVKSIDRLMAVLATPSASQMCINATQAEINTAYDDLNIARTNFITSWGQFKFGISNYTGIGTEPSSRNNEYIMLRSDTRTPLPTNGPGQNNFQSETQQWYDRQYAITITAIDDKLKTGRNGIKKWGNFFACDTLCFNNGQGGTASIQNGDPTCTCPAGTFPVLDSDGFVTCEPISGELKEIYESKLSSLNSLLSINLATGKLSFTCDGRTCPTNVILANEIRVNTLVNLPDTSIVASNNGNGKAVNITGALPNGWGSIIVIESQIFGTNKFTPGSDRASTLTNLINYINTNFPEHKNKLNSIKYIGFERIVSGADTGKLIIRYGNRIPINITDNSVVCSNANTSVNCSTTIPGLIIETIKAYNSSSITSNGTGMFYYELNWI